jgi:hypothetical protein
MIRLHSPFIIQYGQVHSATAPARQVSNGNDLAAARLAPPNPLHFPVVESPAVALEQTIPDGNTGGPTADRVRSPRRSDRLETDGRYGVDDDLRVTGRRPSHSPDPDINTDMPDASALRRSSRQRQQRLDSHEDVAAILMGLKAGSNSKQ